LPVAMMFFRVWQVPRQAEGGPAGQEPCDWGGPAPGAAQSGGVQVFNGAEREI